MLPSYGSTSAVTVNIHLEKNGRSFLIEENQLETISITAGGMGLCRRIGGFSGGLWGNTRRYSFDGASFFGIPHIGQQRHA